MCPGYGRRSPGRLRLKDLLWRIDLTLAPASLSIVRNQTYLQQYVDRGVPAVLGYRDREALAWPICSSASPGELRHESVPVAAVSEVTVETAAGAGTFNGEFVSGTARWD